MGDAPARAEADRQQPQPAPAAPPVPPPPKLWGVRQQDPPCCIMPQVFLGSAATESNREWLDAANITHVLQAGRDLKPSHSPGLKYHHLPANDYPWQDLRQFFAEAFEFIEQARQGTGGVLVHCLAGMSRSASICIAYIMWKQRLSYADARDLVWQARPVIKPNSGFETQLRQFEAQLRQMPEAPEAEDSSLKGNACSCSLSMPPWDFDEWRRSRGQHAAQQSVDDDGDEEEELMCGFAGSAYNWLQQPAAQ